MGATFAAGGVVNAGTARLAIGSTTGLAVLLQRSTSAARNAYSVPLFSLPDKLATSSTNFAPWLCPYEGTAQPLLSYLWT